MIFAQELHLSNRLHEGFSSLLLVVMLHPYFLTYERVLGVMYGVGMHKSLKLPLN